MTESHSGECSPRVVWQDSQRITVGDVRFKLLGEQLGDIERDEFRLLKTESLVREYESIADEWRGGRLVELGIFLGGSAVFLNELCRPQSLLAVDLRKKASRPLRRYLSQPGTPSALHCHWEVDQADRSTLRRLVREEVGLPLDGVIDDASHMLQPSMASFDALFPLLRQGGTYIIEDWSGTLALIHATLTEDNIRAAIDAAVRDAKVLVRLYALAPELLRALMIRRPRDCQELRAAHPEIVEAILASSSVDEVRKIGGVVEAGSADDNRRAMKQKPIEADLCFMVALLIAVCRKRPDVVASVEVSKGFAKVRRGHADVDPSAFALAELADVPMPAL